MTAGCAGSGEVVLYFDALRLQNLADDAEGQPGSVPLSGQHSGKAASSDLGVEAAGGGQLAFHEAPRRFELLVGVEAVHGLIDGLGVDAPVAKLCGQGALCQPSTVVAGVDPRFGERLIVDQAQLGEAVKDRLRGFVRHVTLTQRLG